MENEIFPGSIQETRTMSFATHEGKVATLTVPADASRESLLLIVEMINLQLPTFPSAESNEPQELTEMQKDFRARRDSVRQSLEDARRQMGG